MELGERAQISDQDNSNKTKVKLLFSLKIKFFFLNKKKIDLPAFFTSWQ